MIRTGIIVKVDPAYEIAISTVVGDERGRSGGGVAAEDRAASSRKATGVNKSSLARGGVIEKLGHSSCNFSSLIGKRRTAGAGGAAELG